MGASLPRGCGLHLPRALRGCYSCCPSSELLLPTTTHSPIIKLCGFYRPLVSIAPAICGYGLCHFPAAHLSITAAQVVTLKFRIHQILSLKISLFRPLIQPQIQTSIYSVLVTHLAAGDTAVDQTKFVSSEVQTL